MCVPSGGVGPPLSSCLHLESTSRNTCCTYCLCDLEEDRIICKPQLNNLNIICVCVRVSIPVTMYVYVCVCVCVGGGVCVCMGVCVHPRQFVSRINQ